MNKKIKAGKSEQVNSTVTTGKKGDIKNSLIGEVDYKDGKKLVISFGEFKGKVFLNHRVFFLNKETGKYHPSLHAGYSMPLEAIKDLAGVLVKADAMKDTVKF